MAGTGEGAVREGIYTGADKYGIIFARTDGGESRTVSTMLGMILGMGGE